MVTALSTLTSLQTLLLHFQSPRSHPDLEIRRLLPSTRSVLPVLTFFLFKGVCEYLDDFVARIDAPQLHHLDITFFNDIVFDAPRFIQFISRTPTLKPLENAFVVFRECDVKVDSSQISGNGSLRSLTVEISCREFDWQVSSLELVCTLCLSLLSTLEKLYIFMDQSPHPHWQDKIENTLWLELLHPFSAVKNLYLSKESVPHILPALQELVEGGPTEVLPTLQNIFVEELQLSEPVQEYVRRFDHFVAMRQAIGHPIAVSHWDRKFTHANPSIDAPDATPLSS